MEKCFLYRFLDKEMNVIYVGKTTDIKSRISTHLKNSHLPKKCIKKIYKIEILKLSNKSELAIKELYYINKFQTEFNVSSVYDKFENKDFERGDFWEEYDEDVILDYSDYIKLKDHKNALFLKESEIKFLNNYIISLKEDNLKSLLVMKGELDNLKKENDKYRCENLKLKKEINEINNSPFNNLTITKRF